MMQECKTLIPKATRGWIRLQDNASCCSRSWIWWCLRRYAVKQLLCAAFASVSFQRHDVPSIFCQQMQEVFQDWNCTDLWPTKGNLTLLYVLIISTLDSAHRKHTRFDNPVLNQVPARLFRPPHDLSYCHHQQRYGADGRYPRKRPATASCIFFMERNLVVCQAFFLIWIPSFLITLALKMPVQRHQEGQIGISCKL